MDDKRIEELLALYEKIQLPPYETHENASGYIRQCTLCGKATRYPSIPGCDCREKLKETLLGALPEALRELREFKQWGDRLAAIAGKMPLGLDESREGNWLEAYIENLQGMVRPNLKKHRISVEEYHQAHPKVAPEMLRVSLDEKELAIERLEEKLRKARGAIMSFEKKGLGAFKGDGFQCFCSLIKLDSRGVRHHDERCLAARAALGIGDKT